MAEQTGSSTLTGGSTPELALHAGHAHQHGRPISWIAVSVIMVGFIVGGISMVPHPTWWLFWTSAGVAAVGCIMTLVARTFDLDWY